MSSVLYDNEGAVARVTLNRPARLNAINETLVAELVAALRRAMADETARAVVLTGGGRAFCAGDDLDEYPSQARTLEGARRYLDAIQDVTRVLVAGPKPVVCAARGWAVGGGFEWLLGCDLVVMSEQTRCFFPEIELGFMVTGGVSALLPRLVGPQRARAMILLGERIDAAEALRLGLAHEVVPDDALEARAMALAERLAALPAHAVAACKRVLHEAAGGDFEQVLQLETEAVARCFLDESTPALVAASASRRGMRRGD